MTFLIDFDGTIALHEYPCLGKPVPHAIRVLKRLSDAGHILILHTMRHGDEMEEAIAWTKDHELEFRHINCNPMHETGSRKVYGNFHIDDHNIGCPLISGAHSKPYVDWLAVEKILEKQKLL